MATRTGPRTSLSEWRGLLVDGGLACPTWPRDGTDEAVLASSGRVVSDELARAGVVGPPTVGVGMLLAAPVLFEHGSDDLESRFLRPIVTSQDRWCELFSEPGCGSDLASLTARAERQGEEWVVSGQKVWTTGALQADYMRSCLPAPTGACPSTRGSRASCCPCASPAVEVRQDPPDEQSCRRPTRSLSQARGCHTPTVVGKSGHG